MGEHFTTVRGRGYDAGEVDEFVARLDRVRAGVEQIGSHEVRGVAFRTVRGGYAIDEVDAWLNEVAAAVDDGTTPEAASDEEAHFLDLLRHPAGERFPLASRLQRSYAIDDVDNLLARVGAGVDGTGLWVSADEVQESIFSNARGGYEMQAVDLWLDLVVQQLRARS